MKFTKKAFREALKTNDQTKVCTCLLNGPLATDMNGNRYDPQAAWCGKVVELGERIYKKKVAG